MVAFTWETNSYKFNVCFDFALLQLFSSVVAITTTGIARLRQQLSQEYGHDDFRICLGNCGDQVRMVPLNNAQMSNLGLRRKIGGNSFDNVVKYIFLDQPGKCVSFFSFM